MINCAKLFVEGNAQKRGDSLLAHAVRFQLAYIYINF